MAEKTDIALKTRRTRAKADCDPQVEQLMTVINFFPPLVKMLDISTPARPMEMYRSIYSKDLPPTDEYIDKEMEYYDNLFNSSLACLQSLDSSGFSLAAGFLKNAANWEASLRLSEECMVTINLVVEYYEKVESGVIGYNEQEFSKMDEAFRAAKRDLCKHRGAFGGRVNDIYYKVRSVKRLLEKLAYVSGNFESADRRLKNAGFLDFNQMLPDLYIDDNGILHKEEDGIMEMLLGLDIRRIRQCKICSNFFWAKRMDAQCCQKKCANVYNQRLVRERKESSGALYKKSAQRKRKQKNRLLTPTRMHERKSDSDA